MESSDDDVKKLLLFILKSRSGSIVSNNSKTDVGFGFLEVIVFCKLLLLL